jgi:hypothetical protein
VLAILVYVTLDLSLASMPGAFVFDAAQSIESPHGGHGRRPAECVVGAAMGPDSLVRCAAAADVASPASVTSQPRPRARPTRPWLPRAAVDPPPPSEDPH